MYIDYRKLNQIRPRKDEIFWTANIFSTLDLSSGYWNIPIHLLNMRMPFGLKNSPACFHKNLIVRKHQRDKLFWWYYLHLTNISQRFWKLYKRKETFLGYLIKYNQISPHPNTLTPLKNLVYPTILKSPLNNNLLNYGKIVSYGSNITSYEC